MAAAIPRNVFLKDRSTKTSRLRAAMHVPGPASTAMDSGTKDSNKRSWSPKHKQEAKHSKATAIGSEDNSATQRRIMLSSCPKPKSRHEQALPSLKKGKPSLVSNTTKRDDGSSGKKFHLPDELKISKVKSDQRSQRYLPSVTKGEAPHVSKPMSKEDKPGKEFSLRNAMKSSNLNAEAPRPEPQLPSVTKGKESKDSKIPRKRCVPEKKVCPMNNAVKPTNVTEEKIKFYNSKYTYNPQFKYNTPVPPCIPVKHRNASDGFLQVAVELMQNTLKRYGTYNGYEKATGGHALPKHLIEKQVQMYLETEGLHGKIDVCITKEMLASASMGIKKGKPRLTINQSTVRERWLEGTLRHEIGTHYYRSVNHSRQLWKRDEERFRLKPKNPTEEGFATLNTVLRHPEPYLCRIALLYYAAYKASCMSFSELFKDLGTFVKDPDTRWHYCLRVKRGLTDTSRPGCYSKDQVYLDGVLRILRHRQTIDFKLLMAMGKISFEDINRLKHMAVRKGTKIPDFLKDTRQYMNHLNNIMKVNRLTDEKLKKLIP
uniref:KIAA0895 n=1 Tax=Leptobrachium leishanense TaxID=445787 RepID=A0A8C5M3S0_9ANUR